MKKTLQIEYHHQTYDLPYIAAKKIKRLQFILKLKRLKRMAIRLLKGWRSLVVVLFAWLILIVLVSLIGKTPIVQSFYNALYEIYASIVIVAVVTAYNRYKDHKRNIRKQRGLFIQLYYNASSLVGMFKEYFDPKIQPNMVFYCWKFFNAARNNLQGFECENTDVIRSILIRLQSIVMEIEALDANQGIMRYEALNIPELRVINQVMLNSQSINEKLFSNCITNLMTCISNLRYPWRNADLKINQQIRAIIRQNVSKDQITDMWFELDE